MRLGHLGAQPVAVLSGRQHGNQTGAIDGMEVPLRVLQALGYHTLVQTNAAGSLHPDMPPQSLMLMLGAAGCNFIVGVPGSDDIMRS